ncbi:MAG: uridine kinase [Lachnospiraceae bacterium]|nr:uridine kinase [Lachnospiraceae bacterium]
MKHLIIGICGGTGSGKSTLADRVYKEFKDEAVYIQMDSFYSNRTDLTYEERVTLNYDHPDAFDMDLFVDSVKALKEGRTVTIPQYDFTTHLRKDEWTTVESKSLIILDGILLFADQRLFDLIDIKIFVDTDADERILRRAKRDMRERGRTLESVISQYVKTAKPMHDQFVEPFRNKSDVVIPGGGKNEIALEMITSFIKNRLKEQ